MDPPTFLLGSSLAVARRARARHQWRRKVKLTVHSAHKVYAMAAFVGGARSLTAEGPDIIHAGGDRYYVTVTNASKNRDITVTHVWFDTTPPVHIPDGELPVRLKYGQPWETSIPVNEVPAEPDAALWLARCQLSPDDQVVKSKPRKNVPPVGTVPRSGGVEY